MRYDLWIAGGRVLDPALGIDGLYDIAVAGGKVADLTPAGLTEPEEPVRSINAAGCIVTPGLIDLHTHIFAGADPLSIEADVVGVRQGVTTVVDAGSAGPLVFDRFRSQVVDPSETRVLSWLNIAADGLCGGLNELADMAKVAPPAIYDVIARNPAIRGIKVRMSGSVLGGSGLQPLVAARRVAREVGLPLFVHVGNAPPVLSDILDLMGTGDIVTHAFHGKPGGILTAEGTVLPALQRALIRGVLLDVGHGTSSLSFRTVQRARERGIRPYSISTDIYRTNIHGPVYSLLTTLSKFLALGFGLTEVIASVTERPAAALGLEDSLGSLAAGRTADISILRLVEGPVTLTDSEGQSLNGAQMLQPVYTIRAGKVFTHADP